ncbi:unnamed protein product [Phytophthora fragariaefolia]|uniref:Unnamed protein product n=1 Tax=Phytophthora fragariaefolia TaxID=1490495 RepID=A0A9W6UEB7_9STRA|nr:unnamed protein product [Phytophthora fragariaefolia]
MDDGTLPLDRAASEERCEGSEVVFKPPKKQVSIALNRKIHGFESQLATIRDRLEARRELVSPRQDGHLPAVAFSVKATSAVAEKPASIDRLKLPLLQRIDHTRMANAPPQDPFLNVENVIHRTVTRELYMRDADILAAKELVAASAIKNAQQLGEDARKRMVSYTQNESGWRFEERAARYQQVMETKQRAEEAQQDAELQRDSVRQMKALLRDPYEELRSSPAPRSELARRAQVQIKPFRQTKEYVWVWILASPSTKLTFTPREETPSYVIDNEKELSTYVVYYIAASDVNTKRVESAQQWQDALNTDYPPTSGWIGCSVHGVPPAPDLTPVRSGIQTWTVAGAGAGHLNGKYVACGAHNNVPRFRSSAGVELFRKCVPVASSLAQVLHGGETAQPESASNSITEGDEEDSKRSREKTKASVVLPSGLATIEKDELHFRSMQQVGAWLNMNESIARNRRKLASRNTGGEAESQPATLNMLQLDGNSVMNQKSREVDDGSDLVESRPEISASLCREWVLFGRCSRIRPEKAMSGVSAPPMKGIGLGCLKRHYYVSFGEKREMTIWSQAKESWLEKNALNVIIERESQMERVHHLSRKCMVKFQQNLRVETEKTKKKLLVELNRIRFLTVKVMEAIDHWRQHARKIGFARYDAPAKCARGFSKAGVFNTAACSGDVKQQDTVAPQLGWSSSITLDTEKQLYKGSKAFVSKVKRFRRSEDVSGRKEQHIAYLGYFETQEEAERAYDEHAASEARRLNTTVENLPRRRNVFRSCGKHFAVESEKGGPSFCIECKTKQLASMSSTTADEWIPPFFYGTGVNYIMKMANDLDFLDDVIPLKAALNTGVNEEAFPMRGNIFLLPKTPIQDPDLAVFTTFPTPTAPRLGEHSDSLSVNDIDDEALGRERIFKAQQIFLQELQIYHPELISDSLPAMNRNRSRSIINSNQDTSLAQYRRVEALYWDHCAAIKILQERPPMALRQDNIWCRPDAGEWASLVVRGANQLHFLFEQKLEKAGREMVLRRHQVLAALRQLNKIPLYFVPSRTNFTELIAAGQQVRGDVVQLEVNNATKRLHRYDSWCIMSLVIQRWFRGGLGRHKARLTRKALLVAYKLRVFYAKRVANTAKLFYESQVRTVAVRKAYKVICAPIYTRSIMMDGELVIVTFHSLQHYHLNRTDFLINSPTKSLIIPSRCCTSCARRYNVKVHYTSYESKFRAFRGVCTCFVCGGSSQYVDRASESWLVRAYSPSHNVIYRLRLDTAQLKQLLSSQMLPQLHQQELSGRYCPLVTEMETKIHEAAVISRRGMFCLENAKHVENTLENWRRMNTQAMQTRKSLLVALENKLSDLDSTRNALDVSIINTKKALDFASRPFSEAQAWDPLENANDWRFIVEKRQLVKRLEETHQEVERLRVMCFQASYDEQYTCAGAAHVQEIYNRYWIPLVQKESWAMENAVLLETTARKKLESFIQYFCDRLLTLQDGKLVPTRRNLIVQSPLWHDMIPHRLDIPGLRRRLNYLRRRTIVLSNMAKQTKQTRRMIVTVGMWPRLRQGNVHSPTKNDLWVTAYDPVDCSIHSIFLEWELMQFLTGSHGRKIWHDVTESNRSAWRSIADIIISLAMLDRFTGEFTLQKLQFFHTLRRLSPQFLSSRVMCDLQAGRKCGQGDEILRQAVLVDGKLCLVAIYENWGDLTLTIYHSASGKFFRTTMPLDVVLDLLTSKPLMLRLWISCVKSNSYSSTLLVHLLKHVRFYKDDNGREDVRIEHEISTLKRSKRYQALLRLQMRQVLVSITEDSAGDFQISGYDVRSELTYKLLVEREALHRILKTSAIPDDLDVLEPFATSASALLLRRNRSVLYEWICKRLRFQSVLEHPELISSATSPLQFGLHVRESFRILNRWITKSPRNPLHVVPNNEITRRASSIDAAAFSNLYFDQLALLAHPQLPFELEKQYVGTMDWIEAMAEPSFSSWGKQLPYMKMDFFVKSHVLFARLRRELEAETKERLERDNWAGMELEDHNAIRIDIRNLMNSATKYIEVTSQHFNALYAAARNISDKWRQVHLELQVATKSAGQLIESNLISSVLNAAQMLKEDSMYLFVKMLNTWLPAPSTDLTKFIQLAIPSDSCNLLAVAVIFLSACLERIETELKATVTNFKLIFANIDRSEKCLEDLRIHKTRVARFCDLLASKPVTLAVDETDNNFVKLCSEVKPFENEQEYVPNVIPTVMDMITNSVVNTGLLISSNNNEPIQEVFLADLPAWTSSPAFPFVEYAKVMVKHLRSFFLQQSREQKLPGSRVGRRTSNGSGVLICQRVPYGVLVYQVPECNAYAKLDQAGINARAVALTRGERICGPTLFWPHQGGSDYYQHLIRCAAVYIQLASSSEEAEIQEGLFKRPTLVRSMKYLPWKQFAIERLRIARLVKQNQMREGVNMRSLFDDAELEEKNKNTISTTLIGFRQLEVSFGWRDCQELRGTASITKTMKKRFAVYQQLEDRHGSHKWKVTLSNPRQMWNAVDIYGQDGQTIQIPCIGYEVKDSLKMEGIQVEVDNVDKPRRLIFSCSERQTRRKYFVDIGYHYLQSLLLRRSHCIAKENRTLIESMELENMWRHRAEVMTIQDWRKLAKFAAQFLVFRRKNGALSLCLEIITPDLFVKKKTEAVETVHDDTFATTDTKQENNDVAVQQLDFVEDNNNHSSKTNPTVSALTEHKSAAEMLAEKSALRFALVRRFQKHQPTIRSAACGRLFARTVTPLGTVSQTAYEWMKMTQEDWSSQELRGMLVLDETEIRKLEKAYKPATRRAREYLQTSTQQDDLGGIELQLKAIVKAMGQTTHLPVDSDHLQSIRMIRWRRRGKEARIAAKRAEAYLADVAEWWRRRLATIKAEIH